MAELTIPRLPAHAFPSFVTTDEQRSRWEVSRAIAEAISSQYEPDGKPDGEFVLYMTPYVYHSDMPTGSLDEVMPQLVEADDMGDPDKLWAELEASKPGDDEPDAEAHWAHVGKVADLFDELFGNPDDIDLGEDFTARVPPPGKGLSQIEESELLDLEELFAHVFRGAYRKELHPRDRMGKWTEKLNAVRSFAAKHKDQLREHVAAGVAAAVLRRNVGKADREGGALHGDVSKAHDRHAAHAERLRAHAREQREREGVKGAAKQARHHGRRVKGHALAALAYAYSEEASRKAGKLGAVHEEVSRDAAAAADELERAKTVKELAHEAARYGVEHREEIGHVIRAAKHVAHGIARSKGLAAADVTEDDEGAAELMLEAIVD